jgi:putative Holliday junction resolvase
MGDVLLGIDYGSKRVGLALKKEGTSVIFPWGVLNNDDNLIERLIAMVLNEGIATIVVGLPLNLDGSDTRSTTAVRAFVEQLTPVVPCDVTTIDERFTTREASRADSKASVSRDERSACLLLDTYVQRHAKK